MSERFVKVKQCQFIEYKILSKTTSFCLFYGLSMENYKSVTMKQLVFVACNHCYFVIENVFKIKNIQKKKKLSLLTNNNEYTDFTS